MGLDEPRKLEGNSGRMAISVDHEADLEIISSIRKAIKTGNGPWARLSQAKLLERGMERGKQRRKAESRFG